MGEARNELVECHVEGESKRHYKQDSQDNHFQECLEYGLKHQHIDASVCQDSRIQIIIINSHKNTGKCQHL